jgi:hypothetical protein
VCARCIEIDDRTQRYRELAGYVSDTAAIEAISRLIAHLAAEKLGLHAGPDGAVSAGSWPS